MCSICGILNADSEKTERILYEMNMQMKKRGPDQSGTYINGKVAFGHNRLAIIDLENGIQPMTRAYVGREYTIVYNGELYNTAELTKSIEQKGVKLQTHCDTEVVLYIYILYGEKCASMLNGIFAFSIYDKENDSVYFARDRFGIKPFFYAFCGESLIFSSEIKALLKYPGIKPRVSKERLWELMFLSPVMLHGGVFDGIEELEPAHHAVWKEGSLNISSYWHLKAEECADSREEIISHTQELLTDAIERQLVSDVPLCTLLSGGLDSSIISSVAAWYYKRNGKQLSTYSFEYEGNKESFHSSLFQPQSDDEYAVYMARWLDTNHKVLTAPTMLVADLLDAATHARDFPGQADIDSSLLYFCRQIKQWHTVAISGECADEIFGGYPWFYRPEMLEKDFFPWIHDPMLRPSLFREDFVHSREGYNYIKDQYLKSVDNCPVLDSDTPAMRTSRIASWLSVNYFMRSLLERKDRMSMAASVEVRVPFADHRILEYVYNVPWEIKFENGTEKALLRNAMAKYLPKRILERKKSPYPKTQNPKYEEAVLSQLQRRLIKNNSPLKDMLDKKAFNAFLNGENSTWFGQLMSRPQLIAWLIQFDIWATDYEVEFI